MAFFNQDLIQEYYRLLEIPYNSGKEKIKEGYRKMASIHHPDKNQGSKKSENFFKKISHAYRELNRYKDSTTSAAKSPFTSQNIFIQKDIKLGLTIPLSRAYLGGKENLRYIKNIYKDGESSVLTTEVQVDIPPKTFHGKTIEFEGMGNIVNGQSGRLVLFVNYNNEQDGVLLSSNGTLQTSLFVDWADVLEEKDLRFMLFGEEEIIIKLNSSKESGYVYEVPKMGMFCFSPLLVQVFYSVPEIKDEKDRKEIARILRKY